MPLEALDHVNVRTSHVEQMAAFYTGVLGMTDGKRPEFRFGGRWLYVGRHAVIHLVGVEQQPAASEPGIEHFAFRGTDLVGLVERLKAGNIAHRVSVVPGLGRRQVHLHDPDGNHVEIGFAPDEPLPEGM